MQDSNKRLLFFASIFAVATAVDLIKFFIFGKPTVINWESFVHPVWVVGSIIVLFLSIYIPPIRRVAFWFYLSIFALSYINIYFAFTDVLTYFCMIFNLVLTSIYFFVDKGTK